MTRPPVDADAIRALADILVQTGLTEIEIAEGDSRIRVARAPAVVQAAVAAPVMAAALAPCGSRGRASGRDRPRPAPRRGQKPHGRGVVYLSPEPGSPAFVTVGQTVTAGQTLLLIEAMKTFNQIKAPKAGTISRILASTGVPVEYGEVLVVID